MKQPASSLRGRPQGRQRQSLPIISGHWLSRLHRFRGLLHLESLEFWQKALYIELAGECYDLAPMPKQSVPHCTSGVLIPFPHLSSSSVKNRMPIDYQFKVSRNIFPASSHQGVREPAEPCIGRRSDTSALSARVNSVLGKKTWDPNQTSSRDRTCCVVSESSTHRFSVPHAEHPRPQKSSPLQALGS